MNRRTTAALATLLALAALSLSAAEPPKPAEQATAPAATKPAPKRAPASPEQIVERTTARMWWNQETKIRELELTAAQRQASDRLLRDFLLAESTPPTESYDEMGNHLARGEADAARKALDDVARAVAAPVRRQGELMISVVSLLTPGQRQVLDRSYPQLLRRPWVRTIRQRRGNDGRAEAEAPAN